jgi:hypothetical protein
MADLTPEEEFALYEAVDLETADTRQILTLAKLQLAFHLESIAPPIQRKAARVLLWNDVAQMWVDQDYE